MFVLLCMHNVCNSLLHVQVFIKLSIYHFTDESHLVPIVHGLRGVTPDWIILGLHLGIDDATLRIIEYDNPRKVADCHQTMLSTWLRQGGANRETLIQALEKMNRRDVIETICADAND